MLSVNELVERLVDKLKSLPDGTETSTSDMINMVCEFNGDPMTREVDLSLDDLFLVDEQLRRNAIKNGIYLDTTKSVLQNMSLPFDQKYEIRRLQQ